MTGIALAPRRYTPPPRVAASLIMSTATIQTDHEGLGEFPPELVSGDELVVAEQRTLLIVDELAGWDEFPAEERPAFAFENLWPEIVSLEPAQPKVPQRSWPFSYWLKRRFSSITWTWIRPFAWGAAVGAATVFLLTEAVRQMRPTTAAILSTRVPFALTTPPSVREDRIVVTPQPVFRPPTEVRQQATIRPPVPPIDASADVRNVAPFLGGMEITSEPEGAQVFVNGRLEGVTPLVIDGLSIGTRVVRVEAENYIGWSSSVRVVANERTRLAITLTRR